MLFRSLKIEGRARGPEYVSTVVKIYKQAVEAWANGEYEKPDIEAKLDNWDEQLSRVFNRGFWDGYYQGQTLGEWNDRYGSKATRRKIYAAHCTNFFKNISVAEFLVEAHPIKEGDELLITGETTGAYECVANDIRVYANSKGQPELKGKKEAEQGTLLCIKTDATIRRGDKLYVLKEVND